MIWLEVLFVLAIAAWTVFALRNIKERRRRGCPRDCTKCGACRSGKYMTQKRDAE